MDQIHTAYIALGSNKGDRFKNIQDAVDSIFNKIGSVQGLSRVYQSPAMGFGEAEAVEDFFNACIAVDTYLPASALMQALLDIETAMGRVRTPGAGYEPRIIDLDLLFFDGLISNSPLLVLPHPRLDQRRFVLQPLQDIASEVVHPQSKKTVAQLLDQCPDPSRLEAVSLWLKNPLRKFNLNHYNYIAIEGNIGAGKTSLAQQIAHDFNAKLILERFADNAFLPKFYEDPQRYAFTLEMSFLADRYQQISDDLAQYDLFKDFMVSDYDIYKSLIFSKITLPADEFRLYRKLFYLMYKDIAKPDLYVYLYQNTARLQENIRKRGRSYEQNIQNEYLDKINAGYLEFLKNQSELKVKIIDISDLDFVAHRQDYLSLLQQIGATVQED